MNAVLKVFRTVLQRQLPSSLSQMTTPIWIGCAAANFRKNRFIVPLGTASEAVKFTPEAIVIHVMDGTERGTDAWFGDASSHVSAHYGVSKAGEVHQYVSEQDVAYHAGVVNSPSWPLLKAGVSPNLYTIGIEHEGTADSEWTDEQYAASAQLISDAAKR